MDDNYSQLTIKKMCELSYPDDISARNNCLGRFNDLNISDIENFLLTRIVPPDPGDPSSIYDVYSSMLSDFRGESQYSKIWLTTEEVNSLEINKNTLQSQAFVSSLLRSLRFWHGGGFAQPAVELLRKMESYTGHNFAFLDIDPPWDTIYIRSCLLLMVDYFSVVPKEWQVYLFNSAHLFLAIEMGLDLDKATGRAIDSLLIMRARRELSLDFATFMLDNKTQIGFAEDGSGPVTFDHWIRQFAAFSKNKFDGISLLNFFSENERWKNSKEEDKNAVRTAITIYSNLLKNSYVFPDEYSENIKAGFLDKNKLAKKQISEEKINYKEIKEKLQNKYEKGDNGEILNIEGVLRELQEYSANYKDPSLAELYYFDEGQNKFVWKE